MFFMFLLNYILLKIDQINEVNWQESSDGWVVFTSVNKHNEGKLVHIEEPHKTVTNHRRIIKQTSQKIL